MMQGWAEKGGKIIFLFIACHLNSLFQRSIVPKFPLCLPAIALAQARRAGAKRTKFK